MDAAETNGPTPRPEFDGVRVSMAKVAYEEGKRLVDDQIAELDSMRQRSVQILAFVGSASAFLVGTGLSSTSESGSRPTGWLVVAAAASFMTIAMLSLSISILLSLARKSDGRLGRRDWSFRLDPRVLVDGWINREVGPPVTEFVFYSKLAQRYSDMASENEQPLGTIRMCYLLFVLAAATQLVLWGVLVWQFA